MRYLLVNHVPFGRGSTPERVKVGDLWLEDLRAQVKSIRPYGRLLVASPLVDQLDSATSASFNVVEIDPREVGFEFFPLPRFISMDDYRRVRRDLKRRLARAVASATVVQADSGGYPIALGSVVWPIAGRAKRRRIWIFDGADPFPRLELSARQEPDFFKRVAKRLVVAWFSRFCRRALADADLVFTHNSSVVERFRSVWNRRCHAFDRSFATDENLLGDAEFEATLGRLRDGSGPLRLVAAGRQIAIKATDQVIAAVALARRRGVACTLDVVGDGDDLERFKEAARESGVADAIRFLGKVAYGEPLFAAWARAQVMVITNLTAETSRNVLLGAARGLPLIMYRNPGADALVEPRGAAWLVPTGDVSALADSFVRAHREREELVGLARAGLQLARETTLDACHRRRAELVAALAPPPDAAAVEAHAEAGFRS
jgi:glycosyltransferase involved in cell wall biosynthesis